MSQPHPVIVVIEDDPQIRRFLRTGLEAHGFEIHEAETGKLGMILAATRKPDLVILDLGLPDIDGLEVVKKLREWTSRPVIILSARNMETDKVAALDTGADDYLTKPFGMDELLARIRVALRKQAQSDSTWCYCQLAVFAGWRGGERPFGLIGRDILCADVSGYLSAIVDHLICRFSDQEATTAFLR